jgi:hypothetical protein
MSPKAWAAARREDWTAVVVVDGTSILQAGVPSGPRVARDENMMTAPRAGGARALHF